MTQTKREFEPYRKLAIVVIADAVKDIQQGNKSKKEGRVVAKRVLSKTTKSKDLNKLIQRENRKIKLIMLQEKAINWFFSEHSNCDIWVEAADFDLSAIRSRVRRLVVDHSVKASPPK